MFVNTRYGSANYIVYLYIWYPQLLLGGGGVRLSGKEMLERGTLAIGLSLGLSLSLEP